MDLKALLAALEAALTELKAAPNDDALKAKVAAAQTAYDEAKAAAEAGTTTEDDPENLDDKKWDDKTKTYIEKLRKESATHRTKNKELVSAKKAADERVKAVLKAAGIEEESEKPEEQVKALTSENQTLAFRSAVLETAVQHGIPAAQLKYFQFLISEATSALQEDEELTEEALLSIVQECKKLVGKKANTSVGAGKEKETPTPGETGEISLAAFLRMGMTAKSKLFLEHPDVYKALVAEAKAHKKSLV